MLLKSPRVRAQLPPEIISEPDNMIRWLLLLKERGCHQVKHFATEDLLNGTKITYMMGEHL